MLTKSIRFNLEISGNNAGKMINIIIFFIAIGVIPPIFDRLDVIFGALFIAEAFAVVGIELNRIFNRSIYGEEAYTYMMMPIRTKEAVYGKIIVGTYWLMFVFLLIIIYAGAWLYSLVDYNSMIIYIGGDILENLAMAFIDVHNTIFVKPIATGSVVFIFSTILIMALIESFVICGLIQLAVIVKNIIEPGEHRVVVSAVLIICTAAAYALCSFVFLWLPGLFFETSFAIPQLIISLALKLALGAALAITSTRLLDTKYALN